MLHADLMMDMAKLRMAEQQRDADLQRLVRQAGETRRSGAIDAVRFRERLTRLFGTIWPATPAGGAPEGA